MTLSLCACSGPKKEDVIPFFEAFDRTLDLDSGEFSGTVKYSVDEDINNMFLSFSLIQTGDMQLAVNLGLEANGNKLDDFINFYIKDGKTYLNYLGQTSQSVAENIGVNPKKKLSLSNPFLDYTDSELTSLFSKVEKSKDTYHMDLKAGNISKILDEFGGIQVEDAHMDVTLKEGYISHLVFKLNGTQSLGKEPTPVTITFDGKLTNINSLTSVSFPEDLTSY